MTRLLPRALAVAVAGCAALVATAAPAAAHPLGNFSVNTYSAVVVEPSAVRVDVVVDRAEIPTRQQFPDLDLATGTLPGGTDGPASTLCADVLRATALRVDGRAVPLALDDQALTLPEGAAGLRTSRLVCALRTADVGDLVGSTVDFALDDVSPAPGWRETTAAGDGVRVDADVPSRSRSAALTAYPEDELAAPLDVPGTTLTVERGTGVVTGTGSLLGTAPAGDGLLRGADRLTTAFTELVAQQDLTVAFGALAVLVAVGLGALHAFAPGHGKTVIAAYLVGRRGTLRDAALLGLSVTVTHTLGVVVLGIVLTAVGLAAPSEVYPVLGTASGVLLIGVGVVLLRSARRTRAARRPVPSPDAEPARVLVAAGAPAPHRHDHHPHEHEHEHGHSHDHPHEHVHHHDHGAAPAGVVHTHGGRTHSHPVPGQGTGWRSVVVVGLAGGLVPSPSALLVLLGGIALGRAWFGLGLVLAYGVGMALSLAVTALLLVRARGRVDRLAARAATDRRLRAAARLATALPVVAAVAVLLGGALVTVRSLLLL